jgi:acetyl esterase/lipase
MAGRLFLGRRDEPNSIARSNRFSAPGLLMPDLQGTVAMKASMLSRIFLAALLLCSAQLRAAATPAIVSQSDCFGAFQSYDQWMDFLWEKNSVIAYLAIRWKFSEAEFNRYRRDIDCRFIKYRSDQYVVQGWLVQPKIRRNGQRLPVIIYNRGGNRSLGAVTFGHLFTHILPMAENGYVVLASQYRGVSSGQDEKASPDQFGGEDVRDVTNLVRLVPTLPQADARNVFMIGQSRGAIMTFRALLDSPLPIRAVAIYSGAYDMHDLLRFRPEFEGLFKTLIPNYSRDRKAALDRRSVTRWAERLPPQTGVLLIHGDDDERAPVASARKLAAELKRLGRPHKIIVYAGESHFLDEHGDEVHAETLKWFRRYQQHPARIATGMSTTSNAE